MKKIATVTLLLGVLMFCIQCNRNAKQNLEGIWSLKNFQVNGTDMSGAALGDWKWEFNDEGGYMTDLAGVKEKGTYRLTDNSLQLKSVTHPERPEQVYVVTLLDSVQLRLTATDNKNSTHLYFLKLKTDDLKESD